MQGWYKQSIWLVIINLLLMQSSYATANIVTDEPEVGSNLKLTQSQSLSRTLAGKKIVITFNEYIDNDSDLGVGKLGKLFIKPKHSRQQQVIIYDIDGSWGDSSSLSLSLGKHLIRNDQILIYQYWAWRGDALISPFGVQKITYQWHNETESYHQLANEVYLEYQGWHGTPSLDGLAFKNGVIRKPVNAEEKRRVDAYISQIITEEQTFVLGKEAESLLTETRAVFKKEIKEHTDYWPKINNSFGYKR